MSSMLLFFKNTTAANVSIRFGCTAGTASGAGRVDGVDGVGAGVDDAGRRKLSEGLLKDIEGCKYLIGQSCSHPFLIVLLFFPYYQTALTNLEMYLIEMESLLCYIYKTSLTFHWVVFF
jgi:hypothetical protein